MRAAAGRGHLGCWLALALALALGACGGEPRLAPLLSSDRVLAFGDSLTHGTGAGPAHSYPAVLAQRIGREVVNAGVPGELSGAGLQRLPAELARVAPKLVVLCHGGNDILRKRSLADVEANLRAMIVAIRASGAQVVLLGVPRPGLFLSSAELYERVADDLEVPLDAEILPALLGDRQYKADTVHPNAAGYARLATAVQTLLRDNGALP